MKKSIRIGVDVGGTYTDICAINEHIGELMVYKLPSSLHNQSDAVVRFMHGTTVATNAILEARGAKTA